MSWIKNIAILLVAFAAMELVAWFTHKYIMHGPLWKIHRDHHAREHGNFFQRNDLFFIVFAIPGMLCIYFGAVEGMTNALWAGIGITLYGAAYFLVHDVFIHRRFSLFRNSNSAYLKAVRRAHKVHHKNMGKERGQCFGLLWVPAKFLKNDNSYIQE